MKTYTETCPSVTTRGKRIISRSDSSTVVTYEEMLLMVSRAQFISVGNYNSNYLMRGEPASAAHEDVFIRFLWKYQQIVLRVVLHGLVPSWTVWTSGDN